ncbi:hypothetical protein PybrP1_011755 [[Pythium] brassicae (nom. inval.)]|nr:hypothetical protein PybrP1_011755 [[Pythium] brassicae (nom. inval.)]
MGETTLFYRALPLISHLPARAPPPKQHKDQATMGVAANADDSDKLPLLFLERSKLPRGLVPRLRPSSMSARLTARCPLRSFNADSPSSIGVRGGGEGRHKLLLVCNAPSHAFWDVSLPHVVLYYSSTIQLSSRWPRHYRIGVFAGKQTPTTTARSVVARTHCPQTSTVTSIFERGNFALKTGTRGNFPLHKNRRLVELYPSNWKKG